MKRFISITLALLCIATCMVSCKKKDKKDTDIDFIENEPEYTEEEYAAIASEWEEYVSSQEALPDDSPLKARIIVPEENPGRYFEEID